MGTKTGKHYIVKVQTPLMGWCKKEEETPLLIYDKNDEIVAEYPAPKGLKRVMGGSKKRYLYAHIDPKNKMITLDGLAPEQDF